MNGFLLNALSNFYLVFGNPGRAVRILIRVLKSEPENYLVLNKIYNICYKEGKHNLFYKILKSIEAAEPQAYLIKWSLGTFLANISKYREAIPYFIYSAENSPVELSDFSIANIYARLGICYNYVGKNSDAKKEFLKVEKNVPWDADMWFGFIQYYKAEGMHEKVIDFVDKKIIQYPYSYPLYYWKANYLAYYHYDYFQSLGWYQKAVRLLWKGYYRKYRVYLSVPLPETIVKEYFVALIKAGKKHKAWLEILISKLFLWNEIDIGLFRTQYLILIEEFYLAEQQCLTIIRRKKQKQYLSVIYSYLSVAQLGLGKIGDSISNAKFAITLNKYNYDAWESLANGLKASKKWEDAIRTLDEMINMDPQNPDWLENLGLCYMNIGDYQNAKKYLMVSLSYDPFDCVAWNTLGDIYQQLNATESAQDAYEKSERYKQIIGK